MTDTIYLGTGKTVDGKFGTFYNVTISLNKITDSQRNMNWKDLEYLLDSGHTIGAHTAQHSRLS